MARNSSEFRIILTLYTKSDENCWHDVRSHAFDKILKLSVQFSSVVQSFFIFYSNCYEMPEVIIRDWWKKSLEVASDILAPVWINDIFKWLSSE